MPVDPLLQQALGAPLKHRPTLFDLPKGQKFKARAYPALPGSGPEGETCRSCTHRRAVMGGAKTFSKCALMQASRGSATDIVLRSPACSRWEPKA